MPVGACEDCAYEDRKIRLEQGSSLLLYTDGVIEAGRQGELLAIEGLESILFENSGLGPMEMVETVCRETIEYAECDLKDDIALVAAGFGR
jgi:serine phosphatase RsbU (regulator of sigma subunit)